MNPIPQRRVMSSNPRMGRAWVITREGTRIQSSVVGIITARTSPDSMKGRIEWLYALLSQRAIDHFHAARYTDPSKPYPAKYLTTNTGAPVTSTIFCGHNHFLVARLAREISIIDGDQETPRLRWIEPDRLICDEQTLGVVQTIPGQQKEAPFSLPLLSNQSQTV